VSRRAPLPLVWVLAAGLTAGGSPGGAGAEPVGERQAAAGGVAAPDANVAFAADAALAADLTRLGAALAVADGVERQAVERELVGLLRARSRQVAATGAWTPGEVEGLAAVLLVAPERFATDPNFRSRVLPLVADGLDAEVPPTLRHALLLELNAVRVVDFAASEALENAWDVAPRRALERHGGAAGTLVDSPELPLLASVYSLPSWVVEPAEAAAMLAAVRASAPQREILALVDPAMRRHLAGLASSHRLRLLDTFGRGYSPWPRDPFGFSRDAAGRVSVVLRPDRQRGREDDTDLGLELLQNLPDDLDSAWGGVTWSVAASPFHTGQVLLTRERAWISLHSLEKPILARLGLSAVPVESFRSAAGIERYVAAAHAAAVDLGALYGRPAAFVHPLPVAGQPVEARNALLRALAGGAEHDLDSLVTLVPREGASPAALVADLRAGEALLSRAPAGEWAAFAATYGIDLPPTELQAALAAEIAAPPARGLQEFLDLTAGHLAREGLQVDRLPLLVVPVSLLRQRARHQHQRFLVGWNNVEIEAPVSGGLRAEGFSGVVRTGDELARESFRKVGVELVLVQPLAGSVIGNGGYRCASNGLRAAQVPPG
jgi:hypothetical protein